MGAWTPEAEPTSTGGGEVTLVEGASLCICTPGGDLNGAGPHGVFFRDTRILAGSTAGQDAGTGGLLITRYRGVVSSRTSS
jgi:hypothetical protein